MDEANGGARAAYPSGWWYGLAAVVAMATIVGTGVVGFGRATDLMDTVDAFQHFGGSGDVVVVTEPGEYAVYHEWLERGDGNPYATGAPAAEPTIQVTGPDGSVVPVEPSGVSYGWGKEQAEAVGSFHATQAGTYTIAASGTEGRLAFGELIPGAPFYGFAPIIVAAAAVVVACAVGSIVVAQRRREVVHGMAHGLDLRRRHWVTVGAGVVVVVLIGGGVHLLGREDDTSETVQMEGPSADDVPTTGTSLECQSDADYETGLCGPTFEELREMNLAYADRLEFSGDLAAAQAIAAEAEAALAPLQDVRPSPTPEQVQEALRPVSTDVMVSSNAVRTSGAAFGIAVDGGCVFGSVHDGTIDTEIGGYVKDGGCLASYGH